MSLHKYSETRCELCGERIRIDQDIAEMCHPDLSGDSVICHAECGLQRDYVVA